MLSVDEKYRYRLWRSWGISPTRVIWVMLNPSTADSNNDDATIRKVVGFSKLWGFCGIEVVNMFAHRTRSPDELEMQCAANGLDRVVGPDNDSSIRTAIYEANEHDGLVVMAWGANAARKRLRPRAVQLEAMLKDLVKVPLVHLGRANDESPRHPLMLPYKTERLAA
jgi:hypothetical protein